MPSAQKMRPIAGAPRWILERLLRFDARARRSDAPGYVDDAGYVQCTAKVLMGIQDTGKFALC